MSKHLCFFSILLIAPCVTTARGASHPIEWQTKYDAATKAARQAGKPILVDFWATWCKPCKAMDEQVWPEPDVQEIASKFVCVSLNLDRSRSEASRWGVHVIPTVIILDPWMNVMYRRQGYARATELAAAMSAIPADFSEIAELQKGLERDSKNAETLAAIGDFYNKRDILDVSNSYYKRALNTKAVENDPATRENLLVSVGVNNLRLKRFEEARKTFEACLKSVPNGSQCAKAMLGLLIAQVEEGKIRDAEKTLEQLRQKYPDSAATRQAEQHFQKSRDR